MSNPNVEKLKALKLTIDKIDKDYGCGIVTGKQIGRAHV